MLRSRRPRSAPRLWWKSISAVSGSAWGGSLLLDRPAAYDEKAWRKVMSDGAPARLRAARDALEAVAEPFAAEGVETALREVVERLGVKPKEVFQPVRVALTGTALGRTETLARIDAALEHAGLG